MTSSSPPAPRTKVAVLSPQEMIVAGISAMLGRHPAHIELVEPRARADVVLYDVLCLADGGEAEFERLVHDPAAVVLAIGRDRRPELLNQALARGADGCVDLTTGESALLAILDVTRAKDPSATTRDSIICGCSSERRASRLGESAGLTGPEAAILTWIVQGLSNVEIAQREFVSVNTVKSHIRSAYGKIGAQTRSQAVLWVLEHGFDT